MYMRVNSAASDEMSYSAESDLGLHSLSMLIISKCNEWT